MPIVGIATRKGRYGRRGEAEELAALFQAKGWIAHRVDVDRVDEVLDQPGIWLIRHAQANTPDLEPVKQALLQLSRAFDGELEIGQPDDPFYVGEIHTGVPIIYLSA